MEHFCRPEYGTISSKSNDVLYLFKRFLIILEDMWEFDVFIQIFQTILHEFFHENLNLRIFLLNESTKSET